MVYLANRLIQVLKIRFLRSIFWVFLCYLVLVFIEISLVGTPVIPIKTPNTKGFQKLFECVKHFIFSSAKSVSQQCASVVINSIPEPALFGLFTNKRLLFVKLCVIAGWSDICRDISTFSQQLMDVGIYLNEDAFLLCDCADDYPFGNLKNASGITNTATIDGHIQYLSTGISHSASVALFKHKRLGGTDCIFAEITLFTVSANTCFFH